MNETISTKYGFAPEIIEKRSLNPKDGKYLQEIYDFVRLRKIENNQIRNEKYDQKLDKRKKTYVKSSRKSISFGWKALKKDASGRLYKSSTENIPFFNRNRIFTIYKRAKLENGTYLYWLEEDGQKVKGRFLRQELFALNNQFLRWDQFSYILRKPYWAKIINLLWIFQIKNLCKKLIFLSKNEYFITSLNCKLKLKEYIYDKDWKIKKLSAKSNLLLEKGPVYQVDIDYLILQPTWYVKRSGNTYHFKLFSDIIDQYSYK